MVSDYDGIPALFFQGEIRRRPAQIQLRNDYCFTDISVFKLYYGGYQTF